MGAIANRSSIKAIALLRGECDWSRAIATLGTLKRSGKVFPTNTKIHDRSLDG